jgi:hypothetical protein
MGGWRHEPRRSDFAYPGGPRGRLPGLVFGTVLAGQVHHHGAGTWVNAGLHYFAPAWTLVWPLLWIAYTFLNAHLHGYGQALGSTAAVVVLALVIAVILRFADRRLPVLTR